MADYWKSTGKRFCDFCKCWTADNKASIDFHERGKNHQANVKRRLGEIKKNSIEKRKKDEASKKMFAQMEKAALAAVEKDIQANQGAVGKSDMKNIVSAHAAGSGNNSSTYPWTAMIAPQGFTYYYNSLTGESSWTMPEVFKKLHEEKIKEEEESQPKKKKKKKEKELPKNPYIKSEERPEEVHNIHPLLGGWSTVRRHEVEGEEESKDQMNQQSTENSGNNEVSDRSEDAEASEMKNDEERSSGKKFKEKVMKTNLAATTDEPVAFKKRKSKSRNMRKRDDDD
ncbi:WW domain-binding protein 4-like [Hydractinia symbiolongicarpus]|uniref:WW domain-binding protein 4-like n=1 Tax=Hydractinia symbiolongicarpus TaxID=13093 RepID=UPI00254CB255|nr:WW domain-binding protein 4-like [Hydractinia symbiolongicarpus]